MPHRPSYREDDMTMDRFPKLPALLFLFLAACRVSEGQAVYGNIIGTVTDPSGGLVPNATIVVTDTDRGVTYQTLTNASGNYEQTHLLAGHYKITITAAGFGPFEAAAEVQIDASTRAKCQHVRRNE